MLIVAGGGLLKIISSLLSDEEFKACIEFCRHLPDYPEGVDLPDTGFLLEHIVRHV